MSNGSILHEAKEYVVIATFRCQNKKTGKMVQTWIIPKAENPITAAVTGLDKVVCFDCPHRGDGMSRRSCYVNLTHGPLGIWQAYKAGGYTKYDPAVHDKRFAGRTIRWGAYGEPVLIPIALMRHLSGISDGWTGYTHQWMQKKFRPYREFLMASCESPASRLAAKAAGWRTFRVRRLAGKPLETGERMCPASKEAGHKVQCNKCRACRGLSGGGKDVAIVVHGQGFLNFSRKGLGE